MNAGEIASEYVIKGIKQQFSNIPNDILGDDNAILKFIHTAIVEADEAVKTYAKKHREAEGLGSTIVLLWLLENKAYCAWCGDSRIYRFNPNNELTRLSHDHSYVQSLVDDGKISEEEAFDHPDGNIITKSLGDNGSKADPELRVYDIYQRDVFMLCSDGLCGLLRDSEINEILSTNCTSSKDSLQALWEAGTKKGWTDNTTIDILCISDGGKPAKGRPDGYPNIVKKVTAEGNRQKKVLDRESRSDIFSNLRKSPLIYCLLALIVSAIGFGIYKVVGTKKSVHNSNTEFTVNPGNSNGDGNTNENSNVGTASPNQESNSSNNMNNNTSDHSVRQSNASNTHSSGSSPSRSNQSGANNVPSSSDSAIPQGAIDRLNQNQQGNQSQSYSPSKEYMQLYDNVLNDYNKALAAWDTVKRQKYRTKRLDDAIYDFMDNVDTNIQSLEKDDNYKFLSSGEKSKIRNFRNLRNDINQNFGRYGTTPPRQQHKWGEYNNGII